MASASTVDHAQMADDYQKMFENVLPDNVVQAASDHLAGTAGGNSETTAYAANGSVASVVIWMKCQCTVKGGKTFDGSVWGASFPGGGALIGDVYTSDLNALYANTTNFALVATSVYTTFIFKDDHGNILGSFQAGSVSTVNGGGGGKGSWS